MREIIKKAIISKRKIEITYLDENYLVLVDPYIYGNDLFQREFVWGWIDHNATCYKFFYENIKDVQITNKTFKVQSHAEYYYSAEEEHFEFIEGIPNYVSFKGDKIS